MEDKDEGSPRTVQNDSDDGNSPKYRPNTRGMKRKRAISDSSTDTDNALPEKNLEVEKNLIIKNNSNAGIKKILKKEVANVKTKEQNEEDCPKTVENDSDDDNLPICRPKTRAKKRKRAISDSSTDDDVLPENTLEVEKNVIASAAKNNLDDASVKKILKNLVTNDHILALVKLQEEEEQAMETEEGGHVPKLTRSKVKELKKVSHKTPWNLENLELTPIKHIPVKTRPEVTALIAHELPEDEDDDEYQPASTIVPSDDDQTLESCSDLESQPRTPATPHSQQRNSPRVLKDGPFKVPQELTPARRKLDLEKAEEEATIALRTRSKLSLSETPIEHIESSFVPPDDIPAPVDNLWSQFLAECLDPEPESRHEDDDDADPEYNVAADPDAHDEDEEALENSIIKISKKELNDLVTELFSIMPEDDCLADNMDVLADTQPQPITLWEGKQEPLSDDETPNISARRISDRITFERRDSTGFSMGKIEAQDDVDEEPQYLEIGALPTREKIEYEVPIQPAKEKGSIASKVDQLIQETCSPSMEMPPQPSIANMVKVVNGQAMNVVNIVVGRDAHVVPLPSAPLPLQKIQQQNKKMLAKPRAKVTRVEVHMNSERCILPEQIIILQQQLRQHIQLAASNFLQLFVHPLNYGFGPTYKGFIESLVKIADKTHNSVADVCNLRPAMELITNWEKKVSVNTPENTEYIQFIQDDCTKWAHYLAKNNYYVGEFHTMFKKEVAESNVFLYPYLLPPRPYHNRQRRHAYLMAEDELITLGLDQFWQYVVDNPKMYPPKADHPRQRWWLNATLELISRHMLPFLTLRMLLSHIANVRKLHGLENPINRFFADHEVQAVDHRILPFNPAMTLYDQPVEEMPKIWLRYLARTQPRFRKYLSRHKNQAGAPPPGIPIHVNLDPNAPVMKAPLPLDFTKVIVTNRKKKSNAVATIANTVQPTTSLQTPEGIATNITPLNPVPASNVYRIEGTGEGARLVPLIIQVNAAENSSPAPRSTPINNGIIVDLTDTCNVSSVTIDSSPVKTIDSNSRSLTTTVNCNNSPITSTKSISTETKTPHKVGETNILRSKLSVTDEQTSKDTLEEPVSKRLRNNRVHCECCMLLRKVCKRQTKITEYFKEKTKKTCFCKDVKLPRITRKLIHLVNTFKDPYRIAMENLTTKLEEAKEQAKLILTRRRQNKLIDENKYVIEDSRTTDVEDLSYVIGYKMKLMARLGPNINLKAKVHSIFSTFNAGSEDPLKLAEALNEALTGHHAALFRDFLPFLTKEQAARMGRFKDYFALVCVADLVKMVEEELVLSACRRAVLQKVHRVLSASAGEPSACQICASLLPAFHSYPHLAQRVFRLFPHTLVVEEETRVENTVTGPPRRKRGTNTQKGKRKIKVSAGNDVTSQTPVVPEKDHACRAENNTAAELPPKINQECEKRITEVSKDTPPRSKVNSDTINSFSNSPDNTAQEDMDITLCSDATDIPNAAEDTVCDDSSRNKADDTNCGNSIQNTVNEMINGSPKAKGESAGIVSQEKENTFSTKSSQNKPEDTVLDASKDKSHMSCNDSSQENIDECGDSSENSGDVTLCGDTSMIQTDVTLTKDDSQMQMDYEADHSSSGEDEETPSEVVAEQEIKEEPVEPTEDDMNDMNIQIFISDIKSEQDSDGTAEDDPQTIKQEAPRENESETETMDSDEETVKSECTEWQRDEDKLILQVIKDNITKEQRGDKPILEFIEDKQVLHLLLESLTHKSEDEIKNRIIYLLQMLLLSDK